MCANYQNDSIRDARARHFYDIFANRIFAHDDNDDDDDDGQNNTTADDYDGDTSAHQHRRTHNDRLATTPTRVERRVAQLTSEYWFGFSDWQQVRSQLAVAACMQAFC